MKRGAFRRDLQLSSRVSASLKQDPPMIRDPARILLQPPAIEKAREKSRRPPGEEIEQQMEARIGGNVDHRRVEASSLARGWKGERRLPSPLEGMSRH